MDYGKARLDLNVPIPALLFIGAILGALLTGLLGFVVYHVIFFPGWWPTVCLMLGCALYFTAIEYKSRWERKKIVAEKLEEMLRLYLDRGALQTVLDEQAIRCWNASSAVIALQQGGMKGLGPSSYTPPEGWTEALAGFDVVYIQRKGNFESEQRAYYEMYDFATYLGIPKLGPRPWKDRLPRPVA